MSEKPQWTERLAYLDRRTEIERKAAALHASIEALGGHPLLTDASTLVSEALCTLGKWHDEGEPGRADLVPDGLGFGQAIAALKDGKKVARAGWNGKGMFLFLVNGSTFKVNRPPLLGIYPEGTEVQYHAHIDMKTAQGYVVPWMASQADMLADDWMIVD